MLVRGYIFYFGSTVGVHVVKLKTTYLSVGSEQVKILRTILKDDCISFGNNNTIIEKCLLSLIRDIIRITKDLLEAKSKGVK